MKLDYVAIETVLERLLDAAPEYNWTAREAVMEDGVVYVVGELEIGGKRATGFGAMKNPDLDMALKSANSEAMKNAAKNGWGVALELWDADHREKLAKQRAIATGSPAALKSAVFELAQAKLGKDKPTLKEIAGLFKVEPGALADPDVLKKILEEEA